MLKQRAVATAGALARYVPLDQAKFFSFIASPTVRSDPWALYRWMHRRDPVRETPFGVWLVGSHAGVHQILRHQATSVDESLAVGIPQGDRSGPFSRLMSRTLLFTDPPDHARLRRLVSRAFTPRTVDALELRVQAQVDALLHEMRPAGAGDLLAQLARPLPVAVICDLLGVLEADRPQFLRWAQHLAPRLDVSLFRNAEAERRGDEAATELAIFLADLVSNPIRRDPDGLIAALAAVEEDGDRLDRDEVVALCGLVLVAGFETTMNLVANGLLALLRHPAELARVRDGEVEPTIAIDELLRYDGPVQLTQRVLLEDVEIGGHTIPERRLVALLIGAANRDPAVFDEPDRLDVGRDPNPHVAFSSGIHYCIGAPLARLEAAIAIPAILRALPDLALAGRPRWRDTFVLRGLTALPVSWRT